MSLPDGVYNLLIKGGTKEGEVMLNGKQDGSVDLVAVDDGSGRQRWVITNKGEFYHIKIEGGLPDTYKYLSANPAGVSVDFAPEDDGSGRQQWLLTAVDDHFEVVVRAGTDEDHRFLSCTPGGYVDLYFQNDSSGRQLWHFAKYIPPVVFVQKEEPKRVAAPVTPTKAPVVNKTTVDIRDSHEDSSLDFSKCVIA